MRYVVHTRQPLTGTRLNPSHPAFVNNAPLFAYNAAQPFVEVSGSALINTGGIVPFNNGMSTSKAVGDAATPIYLEVNRNFGPLTRNCEVIIGFTCRSLAAAAPLFSTGNDSNRAGIKLRINTNGSIELLSGDDVGTAAGVNQRAILSPASTITTNIAYSLCCGFTSATTGHMIVNGAEKTVSTAGSASTYGVGTGNGVLHSMLGIGGGQYPTNQEIAYFILLPNVLNVGLARNISNNPWQLFEDYYRPMMLDTVATSFNPAWAVNSTVTIQSRMAA